MQVMESSDIADFPFCRMIGEGNFRASLFIVMSDSSARRTEHRNRSVHRVHEDFEHRSTTQLKRGINK